MRRQFSVVTVRGFAVILAYYIVLVKGTSTGRAKENNIRAKEDGPMSVRRTTRQRGGKEEMEGTRDRGQDQATLGQEGACSPTKQRPTATNARGGHVVRQTPGK